MAHTYGVLPGGSNGSGTAATAFGQIGPREVRRLGRVGGTLFLAAAAFSFPAGFALEPPVAPETHLLGLTSLVIGAAAFLLPWERLSPNWLHAVLTAGVIEVALAVAYFSQDFAFYYVPVAAYAAYVVRDRRTLLWYLALITLALVAPLAYDSENFREEALHILVTLPVLMIMSGLVLYLRDVLEEREERYRTFALEAVALAIRIRGDRRLTRRADAFEARLDELAVQAERQLRPPVARRILNQLERGRSGVPH